MVTMRQVRDGFGQWTNQEIIPLLTGAKRFGASVYMTLAMDNLENKLTDWMHMPALDMLGLMDEHGNVDIDRLHDAAMERLSPDERMELEVPVIGIITFRRSDIDKLYEMIKRA